MKLLGFLKAFGYEVTRIRNEVQGSAVDSRGGGWFNIVREAWGGAWAANITIDGQKEVLSFSAVYACVTGIAGDISKMRAMLVGEDETTGICTEVKAQSAFKTVLKKPNQYQTWLKFAEQWIVSKLLFGNTYVLKVRDRRGIVTGMYILDAQRVTPLVTDSGSVYYKLSSDNLAGLKEGVTVPASEIIHDTMVCLWHPLVGVSPIYACGLSATQGRKIQKNSTKFFDNMSRPSGMLTAPGSISDEVANRLKESWEENFSGNNIGRLAVLGDNLKYEAMTIPAVEAQLIEQLKWTVEDVARCFHYPLYKIGGAVPPHLSIDAMQQSYYSDCLQTLVEAMEACLDEGLNLPDNYDIELDVDNLLRMNQTARYAAISEAIKGAWMSPNEGRRRENLPPVTGGNSPMIQEQNYSLEAVGKRDALPDPFAKTPAPAPKPAANDPNMNEDNAKIAAQIADLYCSGLIPNAGS